MKKRILSLILCIVMCMGIVGIFAGCGGEEDGTGAPTLPGNNNITTTQIPANKDAFVIMSEELDGLFNPFYSTSGADSTIVSMTQIGMLTSKYVNGEVQVAYGENEAVVTKDYKSEYNSVANTTTYTFVLKNGIKYSDGTPLTMEDVLFNLYVYLDPVYAGSATLYSTKIQGLTAYRTQKYDSNTGSDADSLLSEQASQRAENRRLFFVNLFKNVGVTQTENKFYADVATMRAAINNLTSVTSDYTNAVSSKPSSISLTEWKARVLADYDKLCTLYMEELQRAYNTAKDAYTEAPFKNFAEFQDQIFCFMCSQGYVDIEYVKVNGKDDKNQIQSLRKLYGDHITTMEQALDYAFNDTMANQFDLVLYNTTSAQTLYNEFVSNAKDVILNEMRPADGSLTIPNISGIVSLGHNKETKGQTIEVNGTQYTVATSHNPDGTVANAGEYDILQITIDGIDPKAVWNFAFAVAPQHIYGNGAKTPVNIESNQFGVDWGSFEFMKDIVQSPTNNKLPVGAGAYKATNRNNDDNPSAGDFYSNKIVYFKANTYFNTVGEGINNAKIDKVRYQVISANNALQMLESGDVHYITPQLTEANFATINALTKVGANYILNNQLGYGYIGVNASYVPDINLRRAIMCAMNTSLAIDYYSPGTAERIFWPMSTVSWAYPKDTAGANDTENGKDYPMYDFDAEQAKILIQDYMNKANDGAGVKKGDKALKLTFTIAGSNISDHPTYKTFRDAAALLNELGWDITVQPDTMALTKLATGSLSVWAAAWGSTIDPDLYQVYHKNSTATSTLAWGYPSIKNSGSREEKNLLDELSDLIEYARETDDTKERSDLYREAMSLILDLAIELPVYQRSVVYVYNKNVIDASTLPQEQNPYSSPLDRIWEIDFVK